MYKDGALLTKYMAVDTFMPAGDAGYSNPEILIPLESVVVLST